MGSVCEYLNRHAELPAYVYMPCWLGWGQAFRRGGPYAGFLGQRYDPLTTECQPHGDPGVNPSQGHPATVRGTPLLPDSALGPELTIDRLDGRRGLLQQLDARMRRAEADPAPAAFDRNRRRAFDLLTSSRVRSCFDLRHEDPRLLDRYGRTLFGHSSLIARRLVEAGVRFVNVTCSTLTSRKRAASPPAARLTPVRTGTCAPAPPPRARTTFRPARRGRAGWPAVPRA
jgi:Protein of unknown function (DUF1501)